MLPRHGAVIFVHGCFWHRHGCRKTTTPKSNLEFWSAKFETNVTRDAATEARLRADGWRVLLGWERALPRDPRKEIGFVVEAVVDWLKSDASTGQISFAEDRSA